MMTLFKKGSYEIDKSLSTTHNSSLRSELLNDSCPSNVLFSQVTRVAK